MTGAVHRHEIPVDDRPHELQLSGAVLHVASRRPDVVEVWTYESGGPRIPRWFQVFGTGHPLPDGARPASHIGSAIPAGGALVWHLFQVEP